VHGRGSRKGHGAVLWFSETIHVALGLVMLQLSINDVISWIEAHGQTVDLLKWLLVGILAWALGVFGYIRTKLKRPRLEVDSFTSRYAWEEMGVIDGNDNNALVIFLIEARITNPTTDPVVVSDFSLQIKRLKRWPMWHQELSPTTLPARVRHTVGDITRLLRNWFSKFPEGPESLTIDSKIEARAVESGFLLFVSASWGYMRPMVENDAIPVKLSARLTTGERLFARGKIMQMKDHQAFERMVPGILGHARNRSTWNIIREKI